jgi:hypothetical protein
LLPNTASCAAWAAVILLLMSEAPEKENMDSHRLSKAMILRNMFFNYKQKKALWQRDSLLKKNILNSHIINWEDFK